MEKQVRIPSINSHKHIHVFELYTTPTTCVCRRKRTALFGRSKMRNYLNSYDLWKVVETCADLKSLRANPNNSSDEASLHWGESKEAYGNDLYIIYSFWLSDVIFSRIMASASAKEAWDKLNEEFHGSDKTMQMFFHQSKEGIWSLEDGRKPD